MRSRTTRGMLPTPLTTTSPQYLHGLQNVALIILSIVLAPSCTIFAVVSRILSPFSAVAKQIKHRRRWRALSSSTFRPRTVLVTGVGMSKGLTLARTFYRAGHRVIGADFEPHSIPVPARFSAAIEKFFPLIRPDTECNVETYTQALKELILAEGVELWVPCSATDFPIEDAEASEVIRKETSCKVIQLGLTLTETLHHKHSFIDNTRKIGLNVPDTHLVTSEIEALTVLYPDKSTSRTGSRARYLMKTALESGADSTLLPRATGAETSAHIKRLNPTPFRPFVLQQYIEGREYCTHSLIINGTVKAWVACPSSELQMHYEALPISSGLSQAMLLFTSIYAKSSGPDMTGHFSLDFMVDESVAQNAEKVGFSEQQVRDIMGKIYPIECNPRVNTAAVLLADEDEDLAEAYLSVLPDPEPKGISNGHRTDVLISPKPDNPGYYWIGHDLVTRIILPLLAFSLSAVSRRAMRVWQVLELWMEFLEYLIYWRDGTYEVWDPWPAWWLYVGYWPAWFLYTLWRGKLWSRCNVSTNKLF